MSSFFCTKDEAVDWTKITKSGTSLALNEHHLLTFFIRLPRQFDDVFDL